jgi:predicted secreted hydrolase
MKELVFPKDEKDHDKIIEWWYWNGHLHGQDGKQYSFMDCLFKADVRRVRLPLLKPPLKDVYFSHSILSDVSLGKFYPLIDYLSLPSRQSFQRPLLFAEYISTDIFNGFSVNLMDEKSPFEYRLKTENFDLNLVAKKKPLLVGGNGFLNLHGRKTYYYSLSDLAVEGSIFLKDQEIKVRGQAWMDHQWADAPYNNDKWTWFSVQLNNHTELLCFEYGDKKKNHLATICYADGRQESFNDLDILPAGNVWKSPKTKAEYELAWKIAIPKKKIFLSLTPLIKNQEMIFGKINYWEGPMAAKGRVDGKKVKGKAFMELVGRPSRYGSVRAIRDIFKAGFKKGVEKVFDKK